MPVYLCLNLFSVINFANSIIMCLGQPMGGMLIFTFIFCHNHDKGGGGGGGIGLMASFLPVVGSSIIQDHQGVHENTILL